ncbi:unnamed protein product [Calypogeia fissa]
MTLASFVAKAGNVRSGKLQEFSSPPGDNGLRLCVEYCRFKRLRQWSPLYDGLVMQQLGWIESGMKGSRYDEIRDLANWGKWYEKKWVGENVNELPLS